MSNRGFIGIIAIWLLALTTLLALTLAKKAKEDMALSRHALREAQFLTQATEAVRWAHKNNFSLEENEFNAAAGEVDFDVIHKEGTPLLKLRCRLRDKAFSKKVETGWKRIGSQWRMVYWKEWTS